MSSTAAPVARAVDCVDYATNPPAPVGTYDTAGRARNVDRYGNYLVVADGTAGVRILDVSDPASPQPVGLVDTPGYAKAVDVDGTHAYVADEIGRALRVISLANPAMPQIVASVPTVENTYAIDVVVAGSFAYVAAAAGGLQVIDISNPAVPLYIGRRDMANAWQVAVSGNYAYVADGLVKFAVLDVSNPALPVVVHSVNTGSSLAEDLKLAGNFAFLAQDEAGMTAVNIANPLAAFVDGYLGFPASQATGIAIDGDIAYVTTDVGFNDGQGGLKIVDISDVDNMSFVASINLTCDSDGIVLGPDFLAVAGWEAGVDILPLHCAAVSGVGDGGGRTALVRPPQAYPNPSRGPATIRFDANGATLLHLSIVDPAGRLIRLLAGEHLSDGSFQWDGRDEAGRPVPDGLYLIRARTSAGNASGRITIVR